MAEANLLDLITKIRRVVDRASRPVASSACSLTDKEGEAKDAQEAVEKVKKRAIASHEDPTDAQEAGDRVLEQLFLQASC